MEFPEHEYVLNNSCRNPQYVLIGTAEGEVLAGATIAKKDLLFWCTCYKMTLVNQWGRFVPNTRYKEVDKHIYDTYITALGAVPEATLIGAFNTDDQQGGSFLNEVRVQLSRSKKKGPLAATLSRWSDFLGIR